MKKYFVWFFCATLVALTAPGQTASRIVYNFNPGWKVFVGDEASASDPDFDDNKWKPVTLPSAWNENDLFTKDIVDNSTGISWYRKHFKIPTSSKTKKYWQTGS